jgi:uncharacterized protein
MTDLPVRRLLVDLQTPLPRHWCGGDAFRTALFNALSMSFPAGEQFFMDSVRLGAERLRPDQRAAFDSEIKGFVGQEATHRHVHAQFNAHLATQGLVNHWEPRIRRRVKRLEGMDARAWVGFTAATEHFTAIMADNLLQSPALLAGCEPRLRDLWQWHASEESEHRSTAFDLYRALGGGEPWRKRFFWVVTVNFLIDLNRQTLNNLWRDGSWWRLSTWTSVWRYTWGKDGWMRFCYPAWRAYFRADFHPSQGQAEPGRQWLVAHADIAVPVARAQQAAPV